VAGWLRWLEGRAEFKGRAVSLLLTDEPSPACSRLTVILGALAPDDFLLLTPLAVDLEHVDDLATVREEGSPETQSPPIEAPAAPAAATWADFVTTGARVELKV
jgi:hypothetical protein